jgi:hypothetical protein
VKLLWSVRFLRPWLFRRWERDRRARLAAEGRAVSALVVGDRAPRFDLPDDAGRLRRSAEWLGLGDVAVWFTNLCELCEDQARELASARARGEIEAPIVAVHLPGAGTPSPSAFRRASGEDLPILLDDGSVGRAWTGEAVPDT